MHLGTCNTMAQPCCCVVCCMLPDHAVERTLLQVYQKRRTACHQPARLQAFSLAPDCGLCTQPSRAAPGLLERPGWSNEDGNPVALRRAPSEARHLGWELAVSTATSPDGWQYASVFKCGASDHPCAV